MSTYNNNNYLYEFDVRANYYKLEEINAVFRNLLNIKRRYTDKKIIDATFIIMNPKDDKFTNKENHQRMPAYRVEEMINKSIPIIYKDAKVNKDELYIMKIMDDMKWDNVNVLSLSDLCSIDNSEHKFKESLVKEIYKEYEDINSIFSRYRKDADLLIEKNRPIICIWGSKCRSLSLLAENYFVKNNINIIRMKNKKGRYYNLKQNYYKKIRSSLIESV